MKLGTNDISSVYLGTNAVNAVYLGANLVWQNAPVATAATGVGSTSFTANWNAYTGAVVYLLDVSTSSTFDTFIYEDQQVNAPTTSYVVIGLEPNTTYYYRVRASTEALTDPDAQAFFDRVTTAGGSLSATEQTAINTLVVQMKADGIWSAMKAIYPMVGASAAACAQNLVSASFTGTFTSGWTFASTGVTPNGTSAYMDTGLLPSTSLTNNSTHLSYYSRSTSGANTGVDIGAAVGASFLPLIQIICNYSGSGTIHDQYSYTNGRLTVATPNSFGFFCGSRTTSTSLKGYKNGSQVGSTFTTANSQNVTTINVSLTIAGVNHSSGISAFGNRECALASIGDGLTDTEASDFYTAVQAFQTTLSRNV